MGQMEHLRIAASAASDGLDLRSISAFREGLVISQGALPAFPKSAEASKQPATAPIVMKMLMVTWCSDAFRLVVGLWHELRRPGKAASLAAAASNLCFVLSFGCKRSPRHDAKR